MSQFYKSSHNSEREIVLDTETTGLDPYNGHRIIEIGCVELINKIPTGNNYHAYINPERKIPYEAYQIHGITDEFLIDKPKFNEIAISFLNYIKDSPLIIHNAGFDLKFLNSELKLIGQKNIPWSRSVDTLMIARKMFPREKASLDALCMKYNVDLSARSFHGALKDANLLAQVYLELCGGRQITFNLDPNVKSSEIAEIIKTANIYSVKNVELSQEEDSNHKKLVKEINNSIWQQYIKIEETEDVK